MTQPITPQQEARAIAWLGVIAPLSYVALVALTKPLTAGSALAGELRGLYGQGALLVGFVTSGGALWKVRAVGARGVLAPALLGLALNLLAAALMALALLGRAG